MSQHFIHYVPRRVVTRFPQRAESDWFAETHDRKSGFLRPMFHTSRQITGAASAVMPGDTIWILGQIFSPWGALPPALDSRIDVERVEKTKSNASRFIAARTSSWFPLADITGVLLNLQTITTKGRLNRLQSNPCMPIGQSLQSMRRLVSPGPLQAWSQLLCATELNFISYRICDGTSAAFAKAKELVSEGETVFWDRWCLPRRLAERREAVNDDSLNDHLMTHLRRSKVVWGIESEKYAIDTSYAAKEKVESIRLGTYRSVKVPEKMM